jgi:hypothetical protein
MARRRRCKTSCQRRGRALRHASRQLPLLPFKRAINSIADGFAYSGIFGAGVPDQAVPVVNASQREQLSRPPLIRISRLERPEQVLHLDVRHDGKLGRSGVDGCGENEESPGLGDHRAAMLAKRGVKNASGKSGVGCEDLADIAGRAVCAEVPDPLGASRIKTKHDDTPQKMGRSASRKG